MNKEYYNFLNTLILIHHSKELHQKYKDAGLSDKRYRWDLLFRSGFSTNVLYHDGLNDDNIDTALRKITGTK